MSPSSDDKEPIVEPTPSDDHVGDLTGRALRQRIRQQELLAELGVLALQGTTFMDMLQHGARITAKGLEAEYCKVLEYIPAENRLLVRAGVGWEEGVVGSATVGADLASPGGYALRTGKPVISQCPRYVRLSLNLRHDLAASSCGVANGAKGQEETLQPSSLRLARMGSEDAAGRHNNTAD